MQCVCICICICMYVCMQVCMQLTGYLYCGEFDYSYCVYVTAAVLLLQLEG